MKIESTQKGFTLIELMIVIAIIGILASIAIPQFSAFRIKAFNAAAISDLHSVTLSQEGLYTDYQAYGNSVAATGTVGVSAGELLDGAAGFVSGSVAGQEMPVSVSTNVSIVSNMTAVNFDNVTTVAKHFAGDREYGQESDQSGLYTRLSTTSSKVTTGNAAAAADNAGVVATNNLDLVPTTALWSVM